MFLRIVLAAAVVLMATVAQADQWTLDVPHTSVQFKVSHLVISKVVGNFGEFSANLEFDGKDVTSGKVDMTVKVASINTDNPDRDKHLRSGDFFAVENHPDITFKSRKVVKGSDNKFQLVGDLTIRGVTKEVTFDCVFNGAVTFMGTSKAGFTAKTTINRQDFGVSWNKIIDGGGLVVGDEVEITLELEFNKTA